MIGAQNRRPAAGGADGPVEVDARRAERAAPVRPAARARTGELLGAAAPAASARRLDDREGNHGVLVVNIITVIGLPVLCSPIRYAAGGGRTRSEAASLARPPFPS